MRSNINNISGKLLDLIPKGNKEQAGKLIDELINECEEAFSVKTLKNPFDKMERYGYIKSDEEE